MDTRMKARIAAANAIYGDQRGERICHLRRRLDYRKFNQKRLAELAGLHPSSLPTFRQQTAKQNNSVRSTPNKT